MPKTFIQKRAESKRLKIVDSGQPLRLVVTDNDVVCSKQANSKDCALARAALRVPGVKKAYVLRTTAYLEYPDKMVRYNLAPSIQKEIVSFDRAKIFASGQYQLTPPSPSNDRSKTAQYRAKRAETKATSIRTATPKSPAPAKKSAKPTTVTVRRPGGPVERPAPQPEPRFQHRTQYVRDAKEPR